MAAGVRDTAADQALRRHNWRALVPFDQAPPVPPPVLEDADPAEQSLRLLRAGIISRRLAQAIGASDAEAIERAQTTRPGSLGPEGIGVFQTLSGNSADGGNNLQSFGPINFPYIIHELVVEAGSTQVAGAFSPIRLTLHITGRDVTGLGIVNVTEPIIWPTQSKAVQNNSIMHLAGESTEAVRIQTRVPVYETGRFLTVNWQDSSNISTRLAILILIEQMAPGAALQQVAPPSEFEPLYRGISPISPPGGATLFPPIIKIALAGAPARAAPAPRARAPQPVAVTFLVRTGGVITWSRTVAATAANLRQCGYIPGVGATDPNCLIHTSASAAADRIRQEQAGHYGV